MIEFGISGAVVMRLVSALTNVLFKHARIAVDVANVFFTLQSLETHLLVRNAFLIQFWFFGGVGVPSAL